MPVPDPQHSDVSEGHVWTETLDLSMAFLHHQRTVLSLPTAAHVVSCHHLRLSAPSKSAMVTRLKKERARGTGRQADVCHTTHSLHGKRAVRSCASNADQSSGADDILRDQDTNRLTTALNTAINAEDYRLAAQIRDRLTELSGHDSEVTADWTKLGIPGWLAERAERIGYRFPTGAFLSAVEGIRSHLQSVSLCTRAHPPFWSCYSQLPDVCAIPKCCRRC